MLKNSVVLDKEKCKGCTTCIKTCPTEAIRVRSGKAHIIRERCIDCGECIRVCPHRAKVAVCDPFTRLNDFEYNVALPAPSLYGQFHNLDDINVVLRALLDIGFHAVYEVARAAELVSDAMRGRLGRNAPSPLISSACPAAVRLICQRFPRLIPNVAPVMAPAELAAVLAREEAVRRTGLRPERIGVFFISPCPAKVTAAHNPLGLTTPVIDGVLSMSECYLKLLPAMRKHPDPDPMLTAGLMGIGWAASGGESASLLGETYIAVDGVRNIIAVLEDIENGKLPDVEFVEFGACTQGCLGGCLTVENPFAARARLKKLMKFLPVSRNRLPEEESERLRWKKRPEYVPVWQLDDDLKTSLEKYAKIEALRAELPGLDCASCGAPSCQAHAEDVVLGYAEDGDCIFRHRQSAGWDGYLPPPFRE